MRYGLIYKYTNKINGKIYIGQTITSLKRRDNKHFNDKNNTYFDRAYKKYAKSNFTLEVLEDHIKQEDLDKKEIYYIKKYNSLYVSGKGYNMTKGGKFGNSKQKVDGKTEDTIKKLLMETNLSFKEIVKETKINYYTISDINNGRCLYDYNLNYPLRKTVKRTILNDENVNEIVDLLLNSDLSEKDIAAKMGISEYTVGQINRGKSKTYCKDGFDYPLRKFDKKYRYNAKLTKDIVFNICKDLILTKDSLKKLQEKYGIKKASMCDISSGKSWKEVTNLFYLPIRMNKEKNKAVLNKLIG